MFQSSAKRTSLWLAIVLITIPSTLLIVWHLIIASGYVQNHFFTNIAVSPFFNIKENLKVLYYGRQLDEKSIKQADSKKLDFDRAKSLSKELLSRIRARYQLDEPIGTHFFNTANNIGIPFPIPISAIFT